MLKIEEGFNLDGRFAQNLTENLTKNLQLIDRRGDNLY